MPTVNIFYKNKAKELEKLEIGLKSFVAEKLSTGEKKLSAEEISTRLISVGGKMIGDVELEVTAHALPERVQRQDDICNEVRKFMQEGCPSLGEVRVWLILCELGHSW